MKDMLTMKMIHAVEDLDLIAEQLDAVAAVFGERFVDEGVSAVSTIEDHFDRYEALYAVIIRYIGEIREMTAKIIGMADND